MISTIYTFLCALCWALCVWYYANTGIPRMALLVLGCFFALIAKIEEKD